VSNVLHHAVEPVEAGHVSRLLFEVRRIAESAPGVEGVLAALRRVEVDMEPQLVIDSALILAAMEPHVRTVSEAIDE